MIIHEVQGGRFCLKEKKICRSHFMLFSSNEMKSNKETFIQTNDQTIDDLMLLMVTCGLFYTVF